MGGWGKKLADLEPKWPAKFFPPLPPGLCDTLLQPHCYALLYPAMPTLVWPTHYHPLVCTSPVLHLACSAGRAPQPPRGCRESHRSPRHGLPITRRCYRGTRIPSRITGLHLVIGNLDRCLIPPCRYIYIYSAGMGDERPHTIKIIYHEVI